MPAGTMTRVYKAPRGKRSRYRKKPSKGLYRAIKQVMDQNVEKKFTDTILINSAVGYDAPIVQKITNISQGLADASNRVGDEVVLAGMYLNVSCHADTLETQFRVIVFQWRDDDASGAPVVGNILQSSGSNVTYMSPYDHDNGAQYTIVYDKSFVCIPGQANGYRQDICNKSLPKTGYQFQKKIHFNAAGITGTNNLYLMVVTRNLVAGGDDFSFTSRITYRDA